MKIPLFLLTLALASTVAVAQKPAKPISKETALKAIELFRADSLSAQGQGAGSIILQFAEQSPDVEVSVRPKVLPWLDAKPQPKHASQLLGAFFAGNIKSQLESGQTKDDSYAGVLQVIATYRQIQQREPAFKVPAVDKLIDLEAQKKLKAYLAAP
jgi:hypothetical protein